MELISYVEQVREHMTSAAALGDDRTREVAAGLATAAAPAVQLVLLAAVNQAVDEITAALLDAPPAPTVAARWDGTELHLEVTPAALEAEPSRAEDGDATARISLRISDALKNEIDAAAAREGVSVNTWLARAAAAATRHPGSRPITTTNTHRVTGWING